MISYTVHKTEALELCEVDFFQAAPGKVDQVRMESSSHHPATRFALLHDTHTLYLRFDVDDKYVRSVHSGFHAPVYQDSCVEFFVQPKQECGYFNFEINAGGTLLASYIEDPTRTSEGFKKFTRLPPELCREIEVRATLTGPIDPEITTPLAWSLSLRLPLSVMEAFTGRLSCAPDNVWRGNFYKCADATSHPHWLSWSPVKELNFHAPECFGELRF